MDMSIRCCAEAKAKLRDHYINPSKQELCIDFQVDYGRTTFMGKRFFCLRTAMLSTQVFGC